MKKFLVASATAGLLALPAAPALAQAASPLSWSANVGLFSNYLFRGVSQTSGEPAVQGGFDLGYATGPVNLYAGTWASNISWLEDTGAYTRSSMEWDFYGGVNGMFGKSDFGYDVGLLYYYYPGTKAATNPNSANTAELYGALSWKWFTAKYSYSLTNYFGLTDMNGAKTDGTWYFDLKAKYDFDEGAAKGLSVWGHYGWTNVKGSYASGADPSYDDWNVGGSYTVQNGVFKDTELGLYYSGTTNINRNVYTVDGRDWAKGTLVAYLKKTF